MRQIVSGSSELRMEDVVGVNKEETLTTVVKSALSVVCYSDVNGIPAPWTESPIDE